MISPRYFAVFGGCLALLSASAMAQPAADGPPARPQHAPAAAPQKQPDAPRPAMAGAPMGAQSQGGPESVIRPAAAVPPERIQVEPAPGARPKLAPLDDPRSVEEDKAEPDATDR
jgi:hypothetical protein